MTTRRDFLIGGGAVLGGAAAGIGPGQGEELGRARTVSIFHTTDLHGRILPTSTYEGLDDVGGLARCATCIRQWRRESPHSLTVDAGDVVQGTAVSLRSHGRLMMEIFNRLGYDAWALGNHDFDWGAERLEALLAASQPAVLTANIARSGKPAGTMNGVWGKVTPWTIREVGGFRIALIGLITPGLESWLAPETLGGVSPLDPVESLQAAVAAARAEKADAVVVIGHMGWRFADDYANPVRALLRNGDGIDVYLAGHSHQNKPSWTVDGVLCSQASYHGIHCGRVDLTFDLDTRRLVDRRVFTVLMDDRYAADPLVMELARPDLAGSDEQLARTVATVVRDIGGTGRKSRLIQVLCESFAAALSRQGIQVDGVFHGSFATGPVAPGPVTVADCWRILPYENTLVVAELTGAEIATVIAEDAADKKSDRTLWPFDVVSDDAGLPTRIALRGEMVAADQRVTLAFNSYDSQSGGRKLTKLREILAQPAAKRRHTQLDTRTALIEYLLDRGEIG